MSSTSGDPTDPEAVEAGTTEESAQPTYGTPADPGQLLTVPDDEAAKLIHKLKRAQDPHYERRELEYRLNERRRAGETSIWVTKSQDQGRFEIWSPPNAAKYPIPVYNKAERVMQRVSSQLFADQYKLEPEPENDSDEAKDAAETCDRALTDVFSEGNLNADELMRAAVDKAHTGGSGYVFVYVDPYAGGRQPLQVEATPDAQHVDQATTNPDGSPAPGPFVTKHVTPEGVLQDHPAGAASDWVPRLDATVYHARNVRFLPWDAMDTWDAEGVLIAEYTTWGRVKRLYKDLAELPPERVKEICAKRPRGWRELLPMRDGKPWDPPVNEDTPLDDRLVAHLRVIYTECADYPDGFYGCVVGEETLASRSPWVGNDEGGRFKLHLPITQCKLWRRDGNPHGEASWDIIGNANEARVSIVAFYFDYLDELRNRKVFIPLASTLTGKEMMLEWMKYIPINPGGEPKYQDIPPLPREIEQIQQNLDNEIDDAMMLQQAGQGLETPDAQSGRAKLAVISQVHAALSDANQLIQRAWVRLGRISLQLMRHGYTKPQMQGWVGEDGEYKLKRWMGSDLSGVKDVKLEAGSGSMLPPMQKIEQVLQLAQFGLVSKDEIQQIASGNVDYIVGQRENPHLKRVKRQIALWENGPPPGQPDVPPQPQPVGPPAPTVVGVDQTGQPQTAMQPTTVLAPVPHPAAMQILAPKIVDSEPAIAQIRARELGRAMAGVKYDRFPVSWQLALNQAYQASAMAASPPPPPQAGGGGAAAAQQGNPQQSAQLTPQEQAAAQ